MTPNITAILIASQKWLQMERLAERYPAAMLPLMDRPFIQHVMETLVNRGCSRFEVVLSHLPEQLEALLGDGKRWGVDIRYHLVSRPERPYRPLKLLGDRADGHPALLVHADRLVQADIIAAKPSSSEDGSVLYGYGDDTDAWRTFLKTAMKKGCGPTLKNAPAVASRRVSVTNPSACNPALI
jgi:dTDP-glucose pyrophosphorylase